MEGTEGATGTEVTHARTRRSIRGLLGWLFIAACVVGGLSVLFVVPGPFLHTDATADAGVVVVERDGRDVAVVVYRDHGANLLDQWLTGNSGGVRIAALDLETGDEVWNMRIEEVHGTDAFLGDRNLIGAGEKNVALRTSFNVYFFSIEDGGIVATDEDLPELHESMGALSHMVRPEGADEFMFFGSGDERPKKIDIDTLEVEELDTETAAAWGCTLDYMQTPYDVDGRIASSASLYAASAEDPSAGSWLPDGGWVLGRAVLVPPDPEVCANEPTDEDDTFPDGSTTVEPLGLDTVHRLITDDVGVGSRALHVVDARDGDVIDSSSSYVAARSAAEGREGRFVVVADRDLTGIAPALGEDARSSVVYTVNSKGELHETILGKHGWFGLPW